MRRSSAEFAQAEARVGEITATIQRKEIRAPFSGQLGLRQVNLGQYLAGGDPIVSVQAIDPVYVTFSVPEARLAEIRRQMKSSKLRVIAVIQDVQPDSADGIVTFLDNSVDPSTGAIRLKGTFDNSAGKLWPGQFVNVVLTLYEQKDAVVAPSAAVQNGPNGQYVYLVKPDMTVELRNIKIARSEANDTVVASGLQAGDQVVVVGQLRLAPGTKVNIGKAASAS